MINNDNNVTFGGTASNCRESSGWTSCCGVQHFTSNRREIFNGPSILLRTAESFESVEGSNNLIDSRLCICVCVCVCVNHVGVSGFLYSFYCLRSPKGRKSFSKRVHFRRDDGVKNKLVVEHRTASVNVIRTNDFNRNACVRSLFETVERYRNNDLLVVRRRNCFHDLYAFSRPTFVLDFRKQTKLSDVLTCVRIDTIIYSYLYPARFQVGYVQNILFCFRNVCA